MVEKLAHPVCELDVADQSIVKMSFMLSYFIKRVISGVIWKYLIVLLRRIFSPLKKKKSNKNS